MKMAFSKKDWERVKQDWLLYWQNKQDRAMVVIELWNPAVKPVKERQSCIAQYAQETTAEQIIDLETRHIEGIDYIGDAFPRFFTNFGPGSAAAYFGSSVKPALDTVWFEKIADSLDDIEPNIKLDTQNYWFQRTHEVLDAALNKWDGSVQVSVTDIGGNLDVLAALRGAEQLLLDLYDDPETVGRLTRKITEVWLQIYRIEADKILSASQHCASWGPFLSENYTYTLQSDFSYMISPAMFDCFVVPDIKSCCDVITDSFYHLDGPGQLVHLDSLLAVDKLKGVQWLPGTGQKPPEEWPEVLKKIKDAGKLNQVYTSPEGAREIKKEFGGEGFVFFVETGYHPLTLDEAKRLYDDLTS